MTVSTTRHDCAFTVSSPEAEAEDIECRRRTEDNEIKTNQIKSKVQKEEREEVIKNYLGTNKLGGEDGGNGTGAVFTCHLDHLEPATAYQLQIHSQSDGQMANITVHTSKYCHLGNTFVDACITSFSI